MKQQTLQPKLRFSEFDGDWESNNLKELTNLLKDGSHGTHIDVIDSEYLLLSAKNVQNGKILLNDKERKISESDYNLIYKNYKLMDGDLLLSIVGSIGRVAIFKNEYDKCAFQRSVAFLRFDEEIPEFIFQLFNSKYFQNQLKIRQVVSAQPGIYLNDLAKILITFPSRPEQQKIANYLTTIDAKINLLEEKKTELSRYKKAMMQKLFSQEIRFKDENGNDFPDWEEKRLGEILNIGNKSRVSNTKNYNKITIKLHLKGIEFSNINKEMADTRPFYIRELNEIIVGKQNYFNGSIAIITDEFAGSICSNAIMSFSLKEDNVRFIYSYLSQSDYMKKREHLANGTGQKELSENDFLNFIIKIPVISEQQKIADFLSAIDESISRVEEQIKETQSFKKAMLQQMFV